MMTLGCNELTRDPKRLIYVYYIIYNYTYTYTADTGLINRRSEGNPNINTENFF